ncbi:MAG: GYD domain-containing protein [Chloroflexota bacterium]
MATYVLLSTLTDEGAETLGKNPERIRDVNKEVEGMGVRVLQQYAVLGPFDFVSIVEAPDNETVARMSIHLAQRGSVKIQTLAAIPIDQFIAGLKK